MCSHSPNCGLSLIEVLVSIVLITSSSYLLLAQTWHIQSISGALMIRNQALLYLDNVSEYFLAGLRPPAAPAIFELSDSLDALVVRWQYHHDIEELCRAKPIGI